MTVYSQPGVMSSSLPQVLSLSRNGTVHSRFDHSFNLEFEAGLVNVNRVDKQLSSFGINLPGSTLDAILPELESGDLAKVHGSSIMIYATRGSVVEIKTSHLKVIDLALRPIVATPSRLAAIRAVLTEYDLGGKVGISFGPVELDRLEALAVEEPSTPAFDAVVRYWVGRGKGLTPSGDDILMGFFMVQQLFSQRGSLTEAMLDFIERNTTRISAAYLRNLKNGCISAYYHDFCQAAAQQNISDLRSAIENIKTIGSTSGYDSLLGMRIGISKIEGELGYYLRPIEYPTHDLSNFTQLTEVSNGTSTAI